MKAIRIYFILMFLTISLIGQDAKEIVKESGNNNVTDNNGLKQGFWEEVQSDMVLRGSYLNGKKEGTWVIYNNNKTQINEITTYKDDFKNGIELKFDAAGYVISENYYVNDKLSGICREYERSKLTKEISYKDGVFNGKYLVNYSDGKTREEAFYTNGEKNGVSKWYYNTGKIAVEYYYVNGSLEGVQKEYYETGQVRSESIAVNNEYEGEYKEYFEDGKIKIIGTLKNSDKDGLWSEYSSEGKVIKKEKYKKGVLIQ